MKLIRKYLECDMYTGFEVHTEKTLNKLDTFIAKFGQLLKVWNIQYIY